MSERSEIFFCVLDCPGTIGTGGSRVGGPKGWSSRSWVPIPADRARKGGQKGGHRHEHRHRDMRDENRDQDNKDYAFGEELR